MSRIRRTDAVLIAHSSQADAPNWWRIYSDGWCEQGGSYTTTAAGEYTSVIRLHIPFKDTAYSIGMVGYGLNTGTNSPCAKTYVSTSSAELKTNDKFYIASCITATPNTSPHHYGQYDWVTRGWLSTEAVESLMQGKTYDSVTQTWV